MLLSVFKQCSTIRRKYLFDHLATVHAWNETIYPEQCETMLFSSVTDFMKSLENRLIFQYTDCVTKAN
jgi:hypothetical protein